MLAFCCRGVLCTPAEKGLSAPPAAAAGQPQAVAGFGHIQLSLWLGDKDEEAGQPAWQGDNLPEREVSDGHRLVAVPSSPQGKAGHSTGLPPYF